MKKHYRASTEHLKHPIRDEKSIAWQRKMIKLGLAPTYYDSNSSNKGYSSFDFSKLNLTYYKDAKDYDKDRLLAMKLLTYDNLELPGNLEEKLSKTKEELDKLNIDTFDI